MMHGHEKSDDAIVAVRPTNKAERSAAEPAEPRAEAKGNAGQQSTHRAQYRVRVAQALACIRRIIAVDTRGGSRMRESCTYGSVRGAPSNGRLPRPAQRDRRLGLVTLILKRASASRSSGEWNDDDFDVLAEAVVVGPIFKAHAAGRNVVDVDVGLWPARRPH